MVTNVLTVTKTGVAGQLAELPQPVKKMYYRGDLKALLERPRVAIVGSRRVSAYGQQATAELAKDISRAGVVIISGLAYGVDSIAHRATLEVAGQTIAVLPSSLTSIYPRAHQRLAEQVLDNGGALVSEYPDDHAVVMKHQFIARNRIIAALSDAVLITEAAENSGSLHTAQFALEQGIEVLAVPGTIYSPTSRGTNKLIKDGAQLVANATDVVELLDIKPVTDNAYQPVSVAETAVLDILRSSEAGTTELQQRSGIEIAELMQVMTMLELKGVVRQAESKDWIII